MPSLYQGARYDYHMASDQTVSEPVLTFATAAGWQAWLEQHHDQAGGVFIKMAKKASGIASVTHDEALDVALCYGWIDGVRKSLDDRYFLQKFTPRRARSLWSKRNIGKVAMLEAEGRMQPAGRAEVERAKQDGRWAAAYDSPANMPVPEDFLQALAGNPHAQATFKTLNRANLFAIAFRLHTAKRPETRQRIEELVRHGYTEDHIKEEYPQLSPETVRGVLYELVMNGRKRIAELNESHAAHA
jgi:uncharacterized protein YdeI (YjbR/CyaY-like superfamily)